MLKLAEKHDAIIIEDDIFADFEPEPAPRFAGFDGFDRVIQVGGFSKTVSAAIRSGYIAAEPKWIDELVDLKLATNQGNGHRPRQFLHRLLADGGHRRHLDGLRAKLSRRDRADDPASRRAGLDALGRAARRHLFLWARLPDGLDGVDIAGRAQENVIFAPGPSSARCRRRATCVSMSRSARSGASSRRWIAP